MTVQLASSGVVSVRNQNRFVSDKKCSDPLYIWATGGFAYSAPGEREGGGGGGYSCFRGRCQLQNYRYRPHLAIMDSLLISNVKMYSPLFQGGQRKAP